MVLCLDYFVKYWLIPLHNLMLLRWDSKLDKMVALAFFFKNLSFSMEPYDESDFITALDQLTILFNKHVHD